MDRHDDPDGFGMAVEPADAPFTDAELVAIAIRASAADGRAPPQTAAEALGYLSAKYRAEGAGLTGAICAAEGRSPGQIRETVAGDELCAGHAELVVGVSEGGDACRALLDDEIEAYGKAVREQIAERERVQHVKKATVLNAILSEYRGVLEKRASAPAVPRLF